MRTESRRQIARGSLLLSFALTLAASGFCQGPAVPGGEPANAVSLGGDEIPFETYRDYLIVVQGSLGGAQRLNFVIDTGTDPSVIDSRIAKKLHMAGVGGTLGVHDRVVAVQQAVLPSVQIGALRAAFLSVLVRDLAFLQKGLGIRIDALIGLDVLRRSNFTIDYPTKRIVFRAAPVVGASAPFQDTAPGLIVQMEVDGVPLHLILDTGASGMLLFQSRIRDRLPQLTGLGERDVIKLGRRLSVPERASSSNASWGHGFRSTERLRRGRSGGQQPRVRWTARPFRRWTQANRIRFPASYVFVEKVGSQCQRYWLDKPIVRLHVEESLLVENGARPHIDAEKRKPLIMSFCRFFGVGGEVLPSRLAESNFMSFALKGTQPAPAVTR